MIVQEAIEHLVTITESLQKDRWGHEKRIRRLEGQVLGLLCACACILAIVIILAIKLS